ncbi:hypothetical protein DPMN_110439 [Dreissena polymorpha]|uniref:Uncharacterized protein n=1 Tax=Dreissena polymorpha TaxID=45954 RepID=A0A9D4QMX3_DREPO|nr:hypothetical protein DPMN_110439 [Dreissena polymorpha]
MVVDDSTTVRERILGTYRELNMNMGIYLGGVDVKANELFKHELKHFRGTFSTLTLNDLDLVEMGRRNN